MLASLGVQAQPVAEECVVLVHGLARTPHSMNRMHKQLGAAGYRVINQGYPSRRYPIEQLLDRSIGAGLEACGALGFEKAHFVTHSLGGILLRAWARQHSSDAIGRVVMLGPPNQGSQVVDRFQRMPGYRWINGPAGLQLGTDADSLPRSLGPVDFELGIIAGTRSINLILSTALPNPDDGKVSVEATRVEGMRELVTVPVSHPFLMKNRTVIQHTLHFLRYGRFGRSSGADPAAG
ncbi:MAG: hypothetical protein QNJ40_06205 [Xanthomonadales bacterium]|nr:hypothetical protein [Xanthomonadales bacterium]